MIEQIIYWIKKLWSFVAEPTPDKPDKPFSPWTPNKEEERLT